MGTMFSLLAKSLGCSAISGYAAHRLLSSVSSPSSLPRSVHVALTGFASYLGLAYYLKVWIQDYFFDWNYYSSDGSSSRDLKGRIAVVTGGTVGGLGFAAAELLYCQGATVVVTVRTREKGQAAVSKLKSNSKSKSKSKSKSESAEAEAEDDNDHRASYVLCDFLSEASVRNCASELRSRFGEDGIDFLVLNAGISSGSVPKSNSKSKSNSVPDTESSSDNDRAKIGAASVWMTNHVGPFVFANELMPLLIQKARQKNKTLEPSSECCPRVVWVSSGAHKRGAIDWDDPFHPRSGETQQYSVYAQSKLANILHAREYQRRVRDRLRRQGESEGPDVKCFAVTPGAVLTNLFQAPLLLYPLAWFMLRTPTKGAQVIKMACLDNDLKGGEYLSNCYVKETQGFESCSNDEEQWKRLWELTEEQVKAKEYEQWFGDSATAAVAAAAAAATNKKTD